MAYRQYANSVNPATTVNSSYTSGGTSLVVASAANLPANPDFIVAVSTAGVIEFMLVTGISGTTLTVTGAQEGSAAANHGVGDSVYLILTAGSLQQILNDLSGIGTFSARPTATTGAKTGMRYRCTDAPYDLIFDGSVWQAFVGPSCPLVLPPTSSWSWDNQGSSTEDVTHGFPYCEFLITSSVSMRLRYRTAPSTPYTITALIQHDINGYYASGGGDEGYAIGFRASDGKLISLLIQLSGSNWKAGVYKWTSSTSFSAAYSAYGPATPVSDVVLRNPQYLRIADDGTNFKFYLSVDGFNWKQIESQLNNDFLTPAEVFWGAYCSTSNVAASLLAWG